MDYLDLRAYKDPIYVEAIKDGEIIRVPESVAIEEDLFILRRLGAPPQQPTASVQSPAVRRESSQKNASIISEWKLGKFGMKKNNVLQDLVPNFHWQISSYRKKMNMSRAKLAQMINASELEVKMIELGELPADDFVLISRIEQLFGLNLRKYAQSTASVNLADLQKRRVESDKKKASNLFDKKDLNKAGLSGAEIDIIED